MRPLQSQASPADSLTTAETIPAEASAEVMTRNLLEAIGFFFETHKAEMFEVHMHPCLHASVTAGAGVLEIVSYHTIRF